MFWGLGLLLLAEQIISAVELQVPLPGHQPDAKVRRYQRVGTSSVAAVARSVLDLPQGPASQLFNDATTRLPFAAGHANISLVVTALMKAIEHTVNGQMTSPSAALANAQDFELVDSPMHWTGNVRSLSHCLVSLKSTISGSCVAGVGLQNLMYKYGDILMDCWSMEDEITLNSSANVVC